jgi:hypothetical protein
MRRRQFTNQYRAIKWSDRALSKRRFQIGHWYPFSLRIGSISLTITDKSTPMKFHLVTIPFVSKAAQGLLNTQQKIFSDGVESLAWHLDNIIDQCYLTSSSSIGTTTLVGFRPAQLSLSILSRKVLQSAVASGTSNPQLGREPGI